MHHLTAASSRPPLAVSNGKRVRSTRPTCPGAPAPHQRAGLPEQLREGERAVLGAAHAHLRRSSDHRSVHGRACTHGQTIPQTTSRTPHWDSMRVHGRGRRRRAGKLGTAARAEHSAQSVEPSAHSARMRPHILGVVPPVPQRVQVLPAARGCAGVAQHSKDPAPHRGACVRRQATPSTALAASESMHWDGKETRGCTLCLPPSRFGTRRREPAPAPAHFTRPTACSPPARPPTHPLVQLQYLTVQYLTVTARPSPCPRHAHW